MYIILSRLFFLRVPEGEGSQTPLLFSNNYSPTNYTPTPPRRKRSEVLENNVKGDHGKRQWFELGFILL